MTLDDQADSLGRALAHAVADDPEAARILDNVLGRCTAGQYGMTMAGHLLLVVAAERRSEALGACALRIAEHAVAALQFHEIVATDPTPQPAPVALSDRQLRQLQETCQTPHAADLLARALAGTVLAEPARGPEWLAVELLALTWDARMDGSTRGQIGQAAALVALAAGTTTAA